MHTQPIHATTTNHTQKHSFTVISPQQFLQRFITQTKQAKSRVWLQSMLSVHGKTVSQITDAATQAAQRNLDVRFHIDAVTQITADGGIPHFGGVLRSMTPHENHIKQKSAETFLAIEEQNGAVIFTNPLNYLEKILPMIGRNHIKIYVVDDTVWFGGVNLTDHAFIVEDIMIETTDPALREALITVFFEINEMRPKKDYKKTIDAHNTLIVDAGERNKSLIYADALTLTKRTQHNLIFISQCVPEGKMLTELIRLAKNGKEITVITSPESAETIAQLPFSFFYQRFVRKTRHLPTISLFHAHVPVHAKILIRDNEEVSTGSHNYVESGILLGTQEIALHTTHPAIITTLVRFAEELATHRATKAITA